MLLAGVTCAILLLYTYRDCYLFFIVLFLVSMGGCTYLDPTPPPFLWHRPQISFVPYFLPYLYALFSYAILYKIFRNILLDIAYVSRINKYCNIALSDCIDGAGYHVLLLLYQCMFISFDTIDYTVFILL